MINKKNLFFFATKELSQDAFLRWLFENYDDPDLKGAVYSLLRPMCRFDEDERITKIKTTPQWCHIDIAVWITTNKRKAALFIEDKTFSSEHNQLSTYNESIKSCEKEYGENLYPVYYKIDYIGKDEKNRIEAAGWNIFSIENIYELLKEYATSKNVIFNQYVEYIATINAAIHNPEKPCYNSTKVDMIQWKAYFDEIIIPELKKGNNNSFWCWSSKAGQYPYVYLIIKKTWDENVPYLEIRSRDCEENGFLARVLCYGVDEKALKARQEILIKSVEDAGFIVKGLRQKRKGQDIAPKQIGFTPEELADTNKKFIERTKYWIQQYLKAMEVWE